MPSAAAGDGAAARRLTKQIFARGKTGAVAFTERFDSALRLNMHADD